MTETIGQFLNRRRKELSEAEGRKYDEPISWRELASRAGVNESNMLAWEKDARFPHPKNLEGLVKVFGPELYAVVLNVSPGLADLIAYEDDPYVRSEIDQAHERAMRYIRANKIASRPAQAQG